MDFQSAMETFAEAWVAANTQTPLTEAAETQVSSQVYVVVLVLHTIATHNPETKSNPDLVAIGIPEKGEL